MRAMWVMALALCLAGCGGEEPQDEDTSFEGSGEASPDPSAAEGPGATEPADDGIHTDHDVGPAPSTGQEPAGPDDTAGSAPSQDGSTSGPSDDAVEDGTDATADPPEDLPLPPIGLPDVDL